MINENKAIACLKAYKSGRSVIEIMASLNIPRSTTYYWIKKYKLIKNLDDIKYLSAYENEKKKTLLIQKDGKCYQMKY